MAGVVDYQSHQLNLPGNIIIKVLRSEEDLFSKEALDSIKGGIPLTWKHPVFPGRVCADNAKTETEGWVSDYEFVNNVLFIRVKIISKSLAEAIKNNFFNELSFGFSDPTFVRELGIYKGQRYEYKLTDIKYNHLAVVKEGKVGKRLSIAVESKNIKYMNTKHMNDEIDSQLNVIENRLKNQKKDASESMDSSLDNGISFDEMVNFQEFSKAQKLKHIQESEIEERRIKKQKQIKSFKQDLLDQFKKLVDSEDYGIYEKSVALESQGLSGTVADLTQIAYIMKETIGKTLEQENKFINGGSNDSVQERAKNATERVSLGLTSDAIKSKIEAIKDEPILVYLAGMQDKSINFLNKIKAKLTDDVITTKPAAAIETKEVENKKIPSGFIKEIMYNKF